MAGTSSNSHGSAARRQAATDAKLLLIENASGVKPVTRVVPSHGRKLPNNQPYQISAASLSSLSPLQYHQQRPQHERYSAGGDGPLHNSVLSIDNDDHREAMRLFLDSLQFAATTVTISAASTFKIPYTGLGTDERLSWDLMQKQLRRRQQGRRQRILQQRLRQPVAAPTSVSSAPLVSIEDEEAGVRENLPEDLGGTTIEDRGNSEATVHEESDPMDSTSQSNKNRRSEGRRSESLPEDIYWAVKQGNVERGVSLFRMARNADILLDKKLITILFFLVSGKNPLAAYEVLMYYNAHPNNKGVKRKVSLYKRMCTAVNLLDPRRTRQEDALWFVESLLGDVHDMDESAKRELYPNLVVSLATQRCVSLGPYAGHIYKILVDEGFEIKLGWLTKLVSLSKYNRQDDLPFHDILARLVAFGGRPHPVCTLQAIHNMFPYTDAEKMCVTLTAWLDLEAKQYREQPESGSRNQQPADEGNTILPVENSLLDLSTLEMVSTGAARAGSSKLIMVVWDVLEHCEYMPTETIYENTVIAFATEGDGIRQAFTAMASMKEDDFPVSRALIRSFSTAIRSQLQTVDNALQVLLDDQAVFSGRGRNIGISLMSLESLNVVMSAYAERGETEQTISILHTMKENGIQPNEDSYSFALEALGKDIHRRKLVGDRSYLHKNLEIASTILARMEEDAIAPSADILRNYIELLCLTKEVETATSIIEEFVADCSMVARINNKTIYRVAMANAQIGNMTKAKELAKKMSEYIPVLHRKIRSKEQRLESVNKMNGRHRDRNLVN